MMQTLNFTPASITVHATAGASLSFSIGAQHADGTPLDLSGYTVTAPILTRDDLVPPVDAFTCALTDVGTLTLSLTDVQTAELGKLFLPFMWPWCVWIQNESGRTQLVHGGLSLGEP